jgi:hypothetical protein
LSVDGLWRRWVGFWDRKEGPESLALVRILVGSVLVADLAGMVGHGLVPDFWLAPPRGLGWAGAAEVTGVWQALGSSAGAVSALFVVAVLGALAVTLGVLLRPAALLCIVATALLAHLAPEGERAIDMLLRIVLVVLALSRADAKWSLESLRERRHGRSEPESIPAWPRLLLFGQLVWVYFSAAQNRGGREWWPNGGFLALSRVLSDPHFARFAPGWTTGIEPFSRVATALTMLFELGSPLILVFTWLDRDGERNGPFARAIRRLRLRFVWLGLGASLHVGIAVTMRLGIFPFGMLALYPLFFAPEELRAFCERVRRLSAKASPNAAEARG